MAQQKVTDYFSSKKRTQHSQLIKSRKDESKKATTVVLPHEPVTVKVNKSKNIENPIKAEVVLIPSKSTIPERQQHAIKMRKVQCSRPAEVIMPSQPTQANEIVKVATAVDSDGSISSPELSRKISSVSQDEIKKKLAECKKETLDDLQLKLKEFQKSVHSLSRPSVSSEKSASTETAEAFVSFHSLAQPTTAVLPLPYKFQLLNEQFNNSDVVVRLLRKRNETCTFSKLKAAVEKIMRRTYELKVLGQIKTVYPKAYIFQQEKCLSSYGNKTSSYELTIEADLSDSVENRENMKKQMSSIPEFSSDILLQRKQTFNSNLLAIVQRHHKAFLENLNPPVFVPCNQLTAWHHRFALDKVPDIEPSALPEAPDVKKFNTAEEVLLDTKHRLDSQVQKALEAICKPPVADVQVVSITEKKSNGPNTCNNSAKSSTTRGIPQSVLDKVRAKEAIKVQMSLTRSKEDDSRKAMFARVPEISRILRTLFITLKKQCISYDEVVANISKSYSSGLSTAEVEKHILLMIETFSDWISMIEIRRGQYIKLNTNVDISSIASKAEQLANV